MKRFHIILCTLAFLQALTSCGRGPVFRTENRTAESIVSVRGESAPEEKKLEEVQNAVAAFIWELNDKKMPEPGSELTCYRWDSVLAALSDICSNLLFHPDTETFPYDRVRGCHDYRSKYLQLQFKELDSESGVIARIDIRFPKDGAGIKAGARYTVFCKKR